MALTVLSLAGAGVVGITMAAPHATGGIQGGSSGGMMNVGYSDGMMGSGSSCPYQGNYPNCQQYMAQHNISNGDCPDEGVRRPLRRGRGLAPSLPRPSDDMASAPTLPLRERERLGHAPGGA